MSFLGSWLRRSAWIYRWFDSWTREPVECAPPKPKARPQPPRFLGRAYFPGNARVRRGKGQNISQRRASKRRVYVHSLKATR